VTTFLHRLCDTTVKIKIREGSAKAFEDLILSLAYTDDTVPRPKRVDTLGKYVYYNLRVRDVENIRSRLEERLQSAGA
jgi:hypothetical protein